MFSLAGALGPELEPTRGVKLADLNGDGLLDALVTNRGAENGIYLNKDGYPDLILANRDGQGNAIYMNDSTLAIVPAGSMKGFDLDVQTVEPMQ